MNEDAKQLKELARRHLKICEVTYRTAIERDDLDIAVHVARSAMSVAFNCYKHLNDESTRDDVFIWNERLSDLWVQAGPTSDYLNRAMKWSADAMSYFFTPVEDSGDEVAHDAPHETE